MQLQGRVCIYVTTKHSLLLGWTAQFYEGITEEEKAKIKRRNMFYCTLSHSVGKPDKEPELWTEQRKTLPNPEDTYWHYGTTFRYYSPVPSTIICLCVLKKSECTDQPYNSVNVFLQTLYFHLISKTPTACSGF